MAEGLILTIVTGLMWTGVAAVFSCVARKGHDILSFQIVLGVMVLLGAWWFCDWGAILSGPIPDLGKLAANMLLAGIVGAGGMFLMISAMRRGRQAATWTVGQSAMVIPFLAGVVIWGDAARLTSSAGVLAVLLGLVFLGSSRRTECTETAENRAGVWFFLAMLTFLIFGLQQMLVSFPSRWSEWSDVGRLRFALTSTGSILLIGIVGLIRRRVPEKETIRLGTICSAFGIVGGLALFAALDRMAEAGRVALTFPLCISTSVTGFAFYSRIVLKEKLGFPGTVGLILGVTGIVLMGL